MALEGHRAWIARVRSGESKSGAAAIRFFSQFIGAGGLCFDIGAHFGVRTAVLTQLGASVVAVEPQTRCMAFLREQYGSSPMITLVQKAVGATPGEAELFLSDSSSVSTLSQDWKESFSRWEAPETVWPARELVEVTTLDQLIKDYGKPQFIKIDVEGYEYQTVAGLSQAIPMLSFEFHTFRLGEARKCLTRLSEMGEILVNYAVEESTAFALDTWLTPSVMLDMMSSLENKPPWYGDIYVRSLA